MSSWTFSSGGIFVRNDHICHPALRAPRKTHVAHVPLINAFPEGAQFCVSTGRNTWYAKPWNHPGGSQARGAQSLQGHLRARDRTVSFNKEQGQTPLLAEYDRDSGLALLQAFRVKTARAYPPHRIALGYARAIKQWLTSPIDSSWTKVSSFRGKLPSIKPYQLLICTEEKV